LVNDRFNAKQELMKFNIAIALTLFSFASANVEVEKNQQAQESADSCGGPSPIVFCPSKCGFIAAEAALNRAEIFFERSKAAAEQSFCLRGCCCEKRQILVIRSLFDALWSGVALLSATFFVLPRKPYCFRADVNDCECCPWRHDKSSLAQKGALDIGLVAPGCSCRTTRKGFVKAGRLLKEAKCALDNFKCSKCEFECYKVLEEFYQIALDYILHLAYYLLNGFVPCVLCPDLINYIVIALGDLPAPGAGLTEIYEFLKLPAFSALRG